MSAIIENYESDVIDYFKHKASKYDLVSEQLYWVLSDKLLWYYLKKNILDNMPESFNFLDAGGGTGRWTLKILEAFPKSRGTIYDLSSDMTNEAIKNAKKVADRLTVINGNLNDVSQYLNENQFDLIYNFHNVLGFVDSPKDIIQKLSNLLKVNGYLVSFLPNKYHCLHFNLMNNAIKEASHLVEQGKGRFTTTMPYISLFTPEDSKNMYESSGLKVEHLTGFPNFIYPGFQETQLEGSTLSLDGIIKENFDVILRMETAHLDCVDIAARGNNIFIAGKK